MTSESSAGHQGNDCPQAKTTRRGTNAYVDMETCLDCGLVLRKECSQPLFPCLHVDKASTSSDQSL